VAAPVVTLVNPFPPRRLALAPGDRVRLSTSVKAVALSWRACAYSLSLKDLRLVTVVRRADNTTRRSAPVLGSSTITTQVAVTTADDGAVVYVEASRKECPAAPTRILSTNTLETGGTILSVSTATPPLVAQDMKPPILKGILWPPTELGKPVTLTVTATNGGGGGQLRSSATVSTNISYQWLNATRFNAAHEEWAVMDGETGPTLELKFPRPFCALSDCGRMEGRFICLRGPGWAVDVCNTGGCTRAIAVPVILRPRMLPDAGRVRRLTISAMCKFAM